MVKRSERARIEALIQALVKKLLDTLTNRLRARANMLDTPEYATAVRTLFSLSAMD